MHIDRPLDSQSFDVRNPQRMHLHTQLSRVILIMILQFFERFMLSVSLRTMKVLMTAVSHAVRCALCVEHGFYQMSEWMCGPGVTPLFTRVPVSMSNYPIIRLSVMHEDVAVYDLI